MICFIRHLGALRFGLVLLTIAVSILVPAPRAPTVLVWPDIVPTLITPAIAPLVLMLLLLDTLMARVQYSSVDETARQRLRQIIWLNIVLAVALATRWSPFFMALGRPV